MPRQFSGNVSFVPSLSVAGYYSDTLISMKWLHNQDETDIDYYEITLMNCLGLNCNTSEITIPYDVSSLFLDLELQPLPLAFNKRFQGKRFSKASITAVDKCGQRSEPSLSVLNDHYCDINRHCQKELENQVYRLSVTLGIVVCTGIVGFIVVTVILVICFKRRLDKLTHDR